MDLGLGDRVVLVTGDSDGFGAAAARMFAAEGAWVAVSYHSDRAAAEKVAADIEERGGRALTVQCDPRYVSSIRMAVTEVATTWGGIDVLVAEALTGEGSGRRGEVLESLPAARWRAELSGVDGVFHTAQAVLPVMKRRGGGRIVVLAAGTAPRHVAEHCGHRAAQAALRGLTDSMAVELVDHGVLCNLVAPGTTAREPDGPSRFGSPVASGDEVAAVVVFLASWANRTVTGSVVYATAAQ